ncbi:golgi-associated PDZ and coiled-coil motif-containing protein [Trichonephila inaurata madagascariensis]|uniref:Golgi-associated PDZ and coiled-coil motif-containing protein n=1 Tax=Trichonephila inaurata madagascariensis TaxID=2747483 RepID=A0A8X6YSE1_9ARAC|nr:golgi-associated PDZ and coiled-coil motif-containing protein [Trichonephila inaurata madagascariensis]GFY76186.1 golgi-associated PDZ and coiled-coil motif-containing protein [Trichonephila inaurata madagascariensis]
MAIGTTGIHWLDLLESEFDKSFVDLDMLIGEIDEDQIEIIYAARQKLTALSTAFAQLSHKSQVVFENSIKLELQLLMRINQSILDSFEISALYRYQIYPACP